MRFEKHFSDFCPIIEKKLDFCVEYESFNFISEQKTHLTKMGYSCKFRNKCEIENSANCPLFHKAPKSF